MFFPRLADPSGMVETILPGLVIGSRVRAEIHYNGTLYVGEYEMLP